jgi:ubiquitin-conjugating enzyme E2 variant
MLVIEALVVVLAVDFVSGLVHWAEDTFFTEDTPLLGRWIVRPNLLHHADGRAFTGNSWLESSWDLALAAWLLLLACAAAGCLTWHAWLFAALGANANQFHKWSHMAPRDVPAPVRWLRRLRVLQPPAHHAHHHRGERNTSYCVVTCLLDPLLDRLRFWRGLEALCVPVAWASRRPDLAARYPPSSRTSQARARLHSRRTVRSERPMASATSAPESPA